MGEFSQENVNQIPRLKLCNKIVISYEERSPMKILKSNHGFETSLIFTFYPKLMIHIF